MLCGKEHYRSTETMWEVYQNESLYHNEIKSSVDAPGIVDFLDSSTPSS